MVGGAGNGFSDVRLRCADSAPALLRGSGVVLGGGASRYSRPRRSRACRQVLGDDAAIYLRHGAVRQALPYLVLAEQRNAEIAAHGQDPTVGAERHHGAVDGAVARIEDIAFIVAQSVALHVPDEGKAEQRRIPAVVRTSGAGRIGRVAGSRPQFRKGALPEAIALHE